MLAMALSNQGHSLPWPCDSTGPSPHPFLRSPEPSCMGGGRGEREMGAAAAGSSSSLAPGPRPLSPSAAPAWRGRCQGCCAGRGAVLAHLPPQEAPGHTRVTPAGGRRPRPRARCLGCSCQATATAMEAAVQCLHPSTRVQTCSPTKRRRVAGSVQIPTGPNPAKPQWTDARLQTNTGLAEVDSDLP